MSGMSFPDCVEPMAATLTQERFTSPDWLFERKLDGIRLLTFKNGRDIRLLSRNRLPQHLPAISRYDHRWRRCRPWTTRDRGSVPAARDGRGSSPSAATPPTSPGARRTG